MIYSLGDRRVRTCGDFYVADNAVVVGSVVLGHGASVWFNSVVRGDNDVITIGDGTNIQDAAVLHVDEGVPLTLGEHVSVGHQAVLHGCTVEDGALVGINAVVLNHAVIGRGSLVGAGALVPEGKVIPERSLAVGTPARGRTHSDRRGRRGHRADRPSLRREGAVVPCGVARAGTRRTMTTAFLYDARFLDHDAGRGHPERSERLVSTMAWLGSRDWFGDLVRVDPAMADPAWVETVHDAGYVARAEEACRSSARRSSTWPTSGFRAGAATSPSSRRAAPSALADRIVAGDVENGFALSRPPGHHAERGMALGFCLFNNVAIAARYLQRAHGVDKVLILDFDVHHGNGTQHAFEEDPSVMYASIHQYPYYPGTGAASETGIGRGAGATVNCPVPAAVSATRSITGRSPSGFVPAANAFAPEFVILSAGFDAHAADPLAQVRVSTECFGWMTERIVEVAERHAGGARAVDARGGIQHRRAAAVRGNASCGARRNRRGHDRGRLPCPVMPDSGPARSFLPVFMRRIRARWIPAMHESGPLDRLPDRAIGPSSPLRRSGLPSIAIAAGAVPETARFGAGSAPAVSRAGWEDDGARRVHPLLDLPDLHRRRDHGRPRAVRAPVHAGRLHRARRAGRAHGDSA